MKVAMLSDADTPGPFRHVPLDWSRANSIEAIIAVLKGDVWHGRELDHLLLDALSSYDVVIINLKHTLWPIVPQLAAELRGKCIVAGYQEGPADLAGRLDHNELPAYLTAIRSVEHLFCFDPDAPDLFKAMRGNNAVSYLPIPAAQGVYDKFRKPLADRPNDPPRICLCQPLNYRRGTYLGILMASRLGARVICGAHTRGEETVLQKLIASAGGRPYTFCWRSWDKRDKHSGHAPFLAELADCRLAINLDTAACYGRFVADCAALNVPCIGSNRTVLQKKLFPELAFDPYRDWEPATNLARDLIETPEGAAAFCDLARDRQSKLHSPDRIHTLFEEALGCPVL